MAIKKFSDLLCLIADLKIPVSAGSLTSCPTSYSQREGMLYRDQEESEERDLAGFPQFVSVYAYPF